MTTRKEDYARKDNEAQGFCYLETVLRELTGFCLQKMRGDIRLVDKLFSRVSSAQRDEFKGWLARSTNIMICDNWPRKNTSVPFIAFVSSGGSETNQVLGDFAGESIYNANGMQTYEIRENNNLEILVGTEDALSVWFLANIVRYVIYTNKLRLEEKQGVANIVLNTAQDVMWESSYFPVECYMKKLRLTYEAYFDWADDVDNIIGFASCLIADGVTITTSSRTE